MVGYVQLAFYIFLIGRQGDLNNMSDLYLAHHGIKGQKWGVRRYQNEDGSLTEDGKSRYSKERPTTWKGPDNARYNRLNRKADKGLRLRAKGQTISDNWYKADIARKGVGLVGGLSIASMYASGVNNINIKMPNNLPTVSINPVTIGLGTAFVSAAIYGTEMYKNSNIRTSYLRDRATKNNPNWAG